MGILNIGGKKNFWAYPILILLWLLLKLGNLGINLTLSIINPKKRLFKPKPKSIPVGWLKFRISFLVLILGISFAGYSYFLVSIAHDLPSPLNLKSLPTPTTTEFYDRNGVLLYRFYEGKNRTPVKLSEIPPDLVHATIAMEDKNFYSHFGVDFYGIARAAILFLKDGKVSGGSTITQQLIKNTLLTPERTLKRKAKEIILAFWTERIFSKEEILEMYFNEVPYGGTSWGIGAAAQTYFGKNVKDLSLAESAFLAGLPASPTTYSPYGTNPELSKFRQKQALRRIVEDGFISQDLAQKAYEETLQIKPLISEIKAPHFVLYVRSKLSEEFGSRFLAQGGLRVYTTLDLKTQEMAERIVSEEVDKLKNLNIGNGAVMIVAPKTGDILAMVGSKNYWDLKSGNFNVATALRQPGSSIKPITYTAAFKQGYSPGTTLLDSPVSFRSLWETYTPVNYDGKFHGPVTIRTALASSLNVPAVKMLAVVGIPELLRTAKSLGITTLNDSSRYGLSLTLGGGEVRMIDMMQVYSTFSQIGKKNKINETLRITDSKGNIIEDNTNQEGETVLEPAIAYLITDILSDNKARTPAFGSNSLLNIPGFQVAVKTGTSDNKRDNWTFGYTPDYVVGVWVGNNDNSPMNQQLASGVTGAAPIWNRIMSEVLKNTTPAVFAKPAGIVNGTVDGHKDLMVAGYSPKSVVGTRKRKIQEEETQEEKEVITFTDPFSAYQSDQSGQPIITGP
ncbi:PBP1A family penicillin-binding protein [Candidatus Daviesbacteria bacterium]|nr:PBP1A family penicillin-binding protein [Candidatus Daviesbacteria bacterium]